MRDLSGAASSDAQRLAKENEELRTQIAEIAKKHDKMQQQVQLAELQMNDLKEQVGVGGIFDYGLLFVISRNQFGLMGTLILGRDASVNGRFRRF